VPRNLAVIEGDVDAEVVALHGDHSQIVKFEERGEDDYDRVVRYISALVNEAPTIVEKNWKREKAHRSA
jgi:hypothetical protein